MRHDDLMTREWQPVGWLSPTVKGYRGRVSRSENLAVAQIKFNGR